MTFVITPEYGLEVSMNQKAFKGGFKPQTMRMLPDKEILESRVASESYEILIYYAFLGNQMLFTTWEELKEQWRIADSIKDAWSQLDPPAFPNYPAMTKGPEAAKDLIESDGRRWINPQY